MIDIGTVFGELKIIKTDYKNKKGDWYYICECSCGKEKSIRGSHLTKPNGQKTCGDCRKISGMSNHPLYPIWNMMIQRCYNKSCLGYYNYGYFGITVCDRWRYGDKIKSGLQYFIDDMGLRPTLQHSVDRIDVMGNYEPSNCKWSTSKEQMYNRTNTILFEYKGQKYNTDELSQLLNIKPATLYYRYHNNLPLDEEVVEYKYDYNGTLVSIPKLSEITKIPYDTLMHRFRKGVDLLREDVIYVEYNGEKMSIKEASKKSGIDRKTIEDRRRLGKPLFTS